MTDKEILTILQEEGHTIQETGLVRLRKKNGWVKWSSKSEAETSEAELKALVQHELAAGCIRGYGRELLHTHFRRLGYLIPRYVRVKSVVMLNKKHEILY